jgi:hypothetical protein
MGGVDVLVAQRVDGVEALVVRKQNQDIWSSLLGHQVLRCWDAFLM